MKEGKLGLKTLKELLAYSGYENQGIISKGEIGRDNAIIDLQSAISVAQEYYNSRSDCLLVVKSDPITFPTPEPGKYAIIVNSNDIGCSGAIPFGFLATIIVPPWIKYDELKAIQEQIHQMCLNLKISVLGGHTEVSSSVNSIIVSGHMFGFVPRDYLVPNRLNIGDKVVQIGYAGAEGTGIIISEAGALIDEILTPKEKVEGEKIGKEISVMKRALMINKNYRPNFIHDATEGGIFGALHEVIAYTSVGIELDSEPFLSPITTKISNWLKIDPFRLISSGALIIFLESAKANGLCRDLDKIGAPCKIIGTIIDKPGELCYNGRKIEGSTSDEIVTALKRIGELKNEIRR